jgi:hypothetical protein
MSPTTIGNLKSKWIFTTRGDVSARAAVVNGLVYFPDWGGNIWCGERKTPVNWEYYPRTDDFSREFADLDDALRYVEQSQL